MEIHIGVAVQTRTHIFSFDHEREHFRCQSAPSTTATTAAAAVIITLFFSPHKSLHSTTKITTTITMTTTDGTQVDRGSKGEQSAAKYKPSS